LKQIRRLDPETVALLACRTVIDNVGVQSSWSTLSRSIGRILEMETRMLGLRDTNQKMSNTVLNHLEKRTNNVKHRVNAATFVLRGHPDDDPGAWESRDTISIGSRLLDIVIRSSAGLFEVRKVQSRKKMSNEVVPTQRFQSWMTSLVASMESLTPTHTPCVIPPKDWSGLYGGGYHSDVFAYPFL
jgi:DNA-directed RNA polymerase, mitochondrial